MTLFQPQQEQQQKMRNEFQRHLKRNVLFGLELCLRDDN